MSRSSSTISTVGIPQPKPLDAPDNVHCPSLEGLKLRFAHVRETTALELIPGPSFATWIDQWFMPEYMPETPNQSESQPCIVMISAR